jgi:hypothetical protein
MALVRCILDKFLVVVCHCFPPLPIYRLKKTIPSQCCIKSIYNSWYPSLHTDGRAGEVGITTRYRLDGSGFETPVGSRYSSSVRTPSEDYPVSFRPTVHLRALRMGGYSGRCMALITQPHVLKERVKIYIHCPSLPLWRVIGRTLSLPFTSV